METINNFFYELSMQLTRVIDFIVGTMFGMGLCLFLDKINVFRALAAYFAGVE